MSEPIKGYKVFNPDWTCRNFQYEVGKTFEEDVTPKCCDRGFHFCTKASDCFNYYSFNPENKVAEVLALGMVDTESGDTKCCTGLCNTGNRNTGDWNLSSFNTGCFMTEEQKIMLFDKPTDWTYRDWINSDARYAFAEYALDLAMDSVVKELGIKYNPEAAKNLSDFDKAMCSAVDRLVKTICPF